MESAIQRRKNALYSLIKPFVLQADDSCPNTEGFCNDMAGEMYFLI